MLLSTKILICGKSGSGKTTYFSRFLSTCGYDYIFLFDHQGEMSQRLGIPAAFTTSQISEQTWKGLVLFDPAVLFPGETQAGFDYFSDYVFQFSQKTPGRKLFCCDEFQLFSSTDVFSWELSRLIENGRRYALDCCFVAQSINLIHNRVRNQLTEIVAFQASDKRVLDCLEQLSFDPAEIAGLKTFHFVLLDLRTGDFQRGTVEPSKIGTNQPETGQPPIEQPFNSPDYDEDNEGTIIAD